MNKVLISDPLPPPWVSRGPVVGLSLDCWLQGGYGGGDGENVQICCKKDTLFKKFALCYSALGHSFHFPPTFGLIYTSFAPEVKRWKEILLILMELRFALCGALGAVYIPVKDSVSLP